MHRSDGMSQCSSIECPACPHPPSMCTQSGHAVEEHQYMPSGGYPGPRFNIKMSSYQYGKSHCGDKTVVRSSYLHNGISYTGKMTSLYWFSPLISISRWILPSQIFITIYFSFWWNIISSLEILAHVMVCKKNCSSILCMHCTWPTQFQPDKNIQCKIW